MMDNRLGSIGVWDRTNEEPGLFHYEIHQIPITGFSAVFSVPRRALAPADAFNLLYAALPDRLGRTKPYPAPGTSAGRLMSKKAG